MKTNELPREEQLRRLLLVKEAVRQLDFKRIHAVMVHLDWKWASHADGSLQTPSIGDIEDSATDLATKLMLDDSYLFTSTGGFSVHTDRKRTFLSIYFSISDGFSDNEDIEDYLRR